jgi:DNA mismatch repair ATPase MutS
LQKCRITRRQTKWLSYDFGDSNELASLFFIILELIKGAFLLEPILFYSALTSIDRNKKSFRNFFETIGVIDAAISTASFRHSINSYSKPEFHNDSESITINGLYHPLIENCIENDISLSDKSVLITGSNMAGKSTFIRAVGINVIMAQALYTSLSTEYRAPFAKVVSSINMSDDILSGKSYYQKEIESIKRIITESEKEVKCIFIIDELFKGTNSFDRIALARSVLEFLSARNSVFVSTHDIELARLLYNQFDLYYFKDNITDGQMTFDYKLNKGIPQKSNAIKLIELNEYPSIIINNAIKYKNN